MRRSLKNGTERLVASDTGAWLITRTPAAAATASSIKSFSRMESPLCVERVTFR